MEIAFDLCSHGALPSISVRSEFHVASREIIHFGMLLLKYRLPLSLVDKIVLALCKLMYGDLSKYGIIRPKEGVFFLKATEGRSAVIDVGTVKKIKTGDIQVLPGVSTIEGDRVVFSNGSSHYFDAIIFATGYRSVANNWLKDDGQLLNAKGLPTRRFPNHWKGDNGVYCVGFGNRGLDGISSDAKLVANDIDMVLRAKASMEKFNKGD
ncbi:hypothetical protein HPP92_019410 [Vanilla planifolia]|uniref:indole-3-pyruvate monooxygenase n=1 Tax=Vanilla planifolia TaxID=51239 RepID=A0A835Q2U0_VANPL|nr:hypothetical protein HPP92_019410 [Vanilla planifolia]